jgi:general secretion pathway protein G
MSLGKGIKWGLGIVVAIFIVNLTVIFTFLGFFGDDKIELIPTDISNPTKFNRELAVQEMKFLVTAIHNFRHDLNRFPNNEESLEALITQPPGLDKWNGPYFPRNKVPLDPWGNPYIYELMDKEHFTILSLGADGKKGGTEANGDLVVESSNGFNL